MTFQVALRGSDGILLASDKQTTNYDIGRWCGKEHQIRWLNIGTKMQISDKHNVLIGISGSDLGWFAAGRVLHELSVLDELPAQLDSWLQNVGDEAFEHSGLSADPHRNKGLLLVLARDTILRLEVGERSCVSRCDSKAFGGDAINPAIFFVERYYNQKELKPVSELYLLAAHTILAGATLNKYIEGLEIMIYRQNSEPMPVPDLDALLETSRKLDQAIVRRIFKP